MSQNATSFSQVAGRPRLSADLVADLLHTAYDIDGTLGRLPSERDQNFRVDVAGVPRYVVKVSNIAEQRAVLDLQHAAMQHLSGAGIGCPVVVRGRDNATLRTIDSHLFRVLTFLPGQLMAHREQRSAGLLDDFGRFLGDVTRAFTGFDDPAAARHLQWDVERSGEVISRYLPDIDTRRRPLVERVLRVYEKRGAPALVRLPHSVIHNDANDHNVLVEADRVTGLIDFGDMVHSVTLNELAVGCAYAMLGQADPLTVMDTVARGYDMTQPLTAPEKAVLPDLVRTRLATSVAISAHQHALDPQNAYLTVSEDQAWQVLAILERDLDGTQG